MPHECTDCGRAFEDGSKEMLSGCPDCGGTTFQFRPDGPEPSEGTDDTPEPPGPGADGVARTVGNAASKVRNLVAGSRRSDDDRVSGVGPGDDSRAQDMNPQRGRPEKTEDPADSGTVADTNFDPEQTRTAGGSVDAETVDTDDTGEGDTEETEATGAETGGEAEPTDGVETVEKAQTTEKAGTSGEAEPTDEVETPEKEETPNEPGAAGGVETPGTTTESETVGEGKTGDRAGQSTARAGVDSADEGTERADPMEADWPGTDDATDDRQQHSTAGSDTAQSDSDTGDGIVRADGEPSGSGSPQDRPPVPDPRPLSARSGDKGEPSTNEDGGTAAVAGEGAGERPSLSELRAELNDQFESIRVVAPGQYELNLMELYDRQEYIIALQEDGKYTVQIPDRWE